MENGILRVKKRKLGTDECRDSQVLLLDQFGEMKLYKRVCSEDLVQSYTINTQTKLLCPDSYEADLVELADQPAISSVSNDHEMYDYYKCAKDEEDCLNYPHDSINTNMVIFKHPMLELDDDYVSSGHDSDDSNAEDYYRNDYPDEY